MYGPHGVTIWEIMTREIPWDGLNDYSIMENCTKCSFTI